MAIRRTILLEDSKTTLKASGGHQNPPNQEYPQWIIDPCQTNSQAASQQPHQLPHPHTSLRPPPPTTPLQARTAHSRKPIHWTCPESPCLAPPPKFRTAPPQAKQQSSAQSMNKYSTRVTIQSSSSPRRHRKCCLMGLQQLQRLLWFLLWVLACLWHRWHRWHRGSQHRPRQLKGAILRRLFRRWRGRTCFCNRCSPPGSTSLLWVRGCLWREGRGIWIWLQCRVPGYIDIDLFCKLRLDKSCKKNSQLVFKDNYVKTYPLFQIILIVIIFRLIL